MEVAPRANVLAAEIAGVETVQFEGVGHFHPASPVEGRGQEFSLSATMEASGSTFSIIIWTYDGAPAPGRYSLGLPGGETEASHHLVFSTAAMDGGGQRAYAADWGEIEITAITPDRVEGSFHFTGFEYCGRSVGEDPKGPCRVPPEAIPGAGGIEGEGTFSVIPVGPGEAEPVPST